MKSESIAIIYQPGFAGHLLEYLLTLDSSTLWIKPTSVQLEDSLENRLNFYSFNNTKQYDHWGAFHESRWASVNTLPNPRGLTKINSVHPLAFDKVINYNKWLIVNLSYADFNNYWLIETKRNWHNFPVLRNGEFEKEMMLRKKISLEISLDKFLALETWTEEYQRISNLINLPVLIDAATELYNSWYTIRVLPYIKKFKTLTDDQKMMYRTARHRLEANKLAYIDNDILGTTGYIHLINFYNRLRAEEWPIITNINDFKNLPKYIELEIQKRDPIMANLIKNYINNYELK
jgi:hypothetical protein